MLFFIPHCYIAKLNRKCKGGFYKNTPVSK